MERTVNIWGDNVKVSVQQNAEAQWIASGSYRGEYLQVKDSTAGNALSNWKDAAQRKMH